MRNFIFIFLIFHKRLEFTCNSTLSFVIVNNKLTIFGGVDCLKQICEYIMLDQSVQCWVLNVECLVLSVVCSALSAEC
jgi:hypothetical protein